MTVYLWHMPVLIVLAGLSLVANWAIGMPLPEPLTAAWWATRPLWLGVAAAAVVPVVLGFGRVERPRRTESALGATPAASVGATAIDAVCGVAGIAVLLVFGFGPVPAGVSLALLLVALVGTLRLARAVRVVGVVGIARVAGIARTAPVAHVRPRHPLPL